jgi:hypothetical protein
MIVSSIICFFSRAVITWPMPLSISVMAALYWARVGSSVDTALQRAGVTRTGVCGAVRELRNIGFFASCSSTTRRLPRSGAS